VPELGGVVELPAEAGQCGRRPIERPERRRRVVRVVECVSELVGIPAGEPRTRLDLRLD
jgi:hypothetical protein